MLKMRKIGSTSIIGFFLICFSNCSSSFKLGVSSDDNPQVNKIFIEGYEVGVSEKEKSTVAVAGEKGEDGYLRIWVWCKNKSDEPINLIPDSVSVVSYTSKDKYAYLYVYPPDKFLKKMKNAQNWAIALQALSAGIDAYNAGRTSSTTTTNVNGSAYGLDGSYAYGSASGTSTTNTYDHSAADAAQSRHQQEINQQQQQYNNVNNAVENGLLKSVTLFPNQEIAGNVMAYYSWGYAYVVYVLAGDELHEITLRPLVN
jgi:hypothetical protein